MREKDEQTRAILETANDAFIALDTNGTIIDWNKQAEITFGWPRRKAIGKPLAETIIPHRYRQDHYRGLKHYFATGKGPILNNRIELFALHRKGYEFPIELTVWPIQSGKKTTFNAFAHDISEKRRLEKELLFISDREKQLIGQELHDGLTQHLTGIDLLGKGLAQKLERKAIPEAKEVTKIVDLVNQANTKARDLAKGLFPATLEFQGLIAALRELAITTDKEFKTNCTFKCSSHRGINNKDLEFLNHLYRIAQEAVRNARSHGKGKSIKIILQTDSNKCQLIVSDDGKGISAKSYNSKGMGMHIMEYRAHLIGGTLNIKSFPNRGTRITCEVPLNSKHKNFSKKRKNLKNSSLK